MPKRTLLLILVLIGTVVFLLALSINTTQTPQETTVIATPSPAQTVLSLSSPVATGAGKQIDVNINTGNNKVTAVQLELEYNPDELTNVDIEPASFFENPVVLFKTINEKDGRVSIAFGVPPGQSGVTGSGTVANLTFNVATVSGQTTISFLPKTLVSAEGIAKSVLKSTIDVFFDLSN